MLLFAYRDKPYSVSLPEPLPSAAGPPSRIRFTAAEAGASAAAEAGKARAPLDPGPGLSCDSCPGRARSVTPSSLRRTPRRPTADRGRAGRRCGGGGRGAEGGGAGYGGRLAELSGGHPSQPSRLRSCLDPERGWKGERTVRPGAQSGRGVGGKGRTVRTQSAREGGGGLVATGRWLQQERRVHAAAGSLHRRASETTR